MKNYLVCPIYRPYPLIKYGFHTNVEFTEYKKDIIYIYNMILSQSIYFSMHVRLGITNFGVNAKTWGMNRGDYWNTHKKENGWLHKAGNKAMRVGNITWNRRAQCPIVE